MLGVGRDWVNLVSLLCSLIISFFVVFLFIFGSDVSVDIFLFWMICKNCDVDMLDKMVNFNLGFMLLVLISLWNNLCFSLLVKLNNSWVFFCIIKWVYKV